jgi:hypothetical protein
VPAAHAAMGSGANYTARYVGSGIGITIVAVLLSRSGAEPGAAGLLSGWNVAVLVTVAFSLLDALTVLIVRERASPGRGPTRQVLQACRHRGEPLAIPDRSLQQERTWST